MLFVLCMYGAHVCIMYVWGTCMYVYMYGAHVCMCGAHVGAEDKIESQFLLSSSEF